MITRRDLMSGALLTRVLGNVPASPSETAHRTATPLEHLESDRMYMQRFGELLEEEDFRPLRQADENSSVASQETECSRRSSLDSNQRPTD